MSEQRNIVVLGASVSGLPTVHYILKFILPTLNAKHDARYHVYLINPSSDWCKFHGKDIILRRLLIQPLRPQISA